MPDFSRFLPLSLRPRGDESGVTSDRRAALADVIDRAAELVATDGQGHSVFAEAFIDDAGLRPDYSDYSSHISSSAMVAVARRVRAGRRRSVKALATGVRALYLLARDLGVDPALDPRIDGAVSLWAATSGPFDRRAAVSGHTVRAVDAEWSFGAGPVLEATAADITAFLLGVSDAPPRPPAVSAP